MLSTPVGKFAAFWLSDLRRLALLLLLGRLYSSWSLLKSTAVSLYYSAELAQNLKVLVPGWFAAAAFLAFYVGLAGLATPPRFPQRYRGWAIASALIYGALRIVSWATFFSTQKRTMTAGGMAMTALSGLEDLVMLLLLIALARACDAAGDFVPGVPSILVLIAKVALAVGIADLVIEGFNGISTLNYVQTIRPTIPEQLPSLSRMIVGQARGTLTELCTLLVPFVVYRSGPRPAVEPESANFTPESDVL